MKTKSFLDLIGLIGGILVILSFLDIQFFKDTKIVFLIVGIGSLVIYTRMYLEEEAISKIKSIEKKLNMMEYNLNDKLNKQTQRMSKIEGWIEAINFFKGKKGALDPITLILIIIIIIIIILALQGKL